MKRCTEIAKRTHRCSGLIDSRVLGHPELVLKRAPRRRLLDHLESAWLNFRGAPVIHPEAPVKAKTSRLLYETIKGEVD